MKVNQLMIGDWVMLNGLAYKVTDFDSDGIITEYCLGEPSRHETDFDPIPLSELILSVNDFSEKTIAWELKKERLYTVAVSLPRKVGDIDTLANIYIRNHLTKTDMESSGMKIVYVHQLQHALRLCGLNDIADDFKLVR